MGKFRDQKRRPEALASSSEQSFQRRNLCALDINLHGVNRRGPRFFDDARNPAHANFARAPMPKPAFAAVSFVRMEGADALGIAGRAVENLNLVLRAGSGNVELQPREHLGRGLDAYRLKGTPRGARR